MLVGDDVPEFVDPFRGWDMDPATEMPSAPAELLARAAEGKRCPKYIALVGDDYLDADDDLATLLRALRGYCETDVVIWDQASDRLAAALRQGRVLRFVNEPPPATTTTSNGHAKQPQRKRGRPRKVRAGGCDRPRRRSCG
jgi:hypothetical protein